MEIPPESIAPDEPVKKNKRNQPKVSSLMGLYCGKNHTVEGVWIRNGKYGGGSKDIFYIRCPTCNIQSIKRRGPMAYSDSIKSWIKKYGKK